MAELVDALDLGSSTARCPSSSLGGPKMSGILSASFRVTGRALGCTPARDTDGVLVLDGVAVDAYNSRVDPDARGSTAVGNAEVAQR